MAPDRPDASDTSDAGGGGGTVGPVVTRVFGFCDAFTLRQNRDHHQQQQQHQQHFTPVEVDPLASGDGDSEIVIEEEEVPLVPKDEDVPKEEPIDGDQRVCGQSDDELTSLSWLHQQNLLKDLDITEHAVKKEEEEDVGDNNIICEDSLDVSENTNSVSSLDESYSPGNIHSGAVYVYIFYVQTELKFILQ